jgi:hypothetical protein
LKHKWDILSSENYVEWSLYLSTLSIKAFSYSSLICFTLLFPEHNISLFMKRVELITDTLICNISLTSDAVPVRYFDYKQNYSLRVHKLSRYLLKHTPHFHYFFSIIPLEDVNLFLLRKNSSL